MNTKSMISNLAKGITVIGYWLLVIGTTSSCADFLEIKSQSEIILEDFWNEKADVDNIVAGCYSKMESSDVITRMIIWGEARSENVMAGSNIEQDANLENILKENITTKNNYTTWDAFYSVINRCNTVLKYAPGVAERDPGYTQSELKATIAEVSALRDLCYFYLIRTFRDVPYSTVAFTDDDQVMDLAPTPFEAVLDSLINDLESVKSSAIRRYPVTKPEYQTGRITQDAIHAMLCEMYLWKKDYDKCKYYADLVIKSKKDLAEERRAAGEGSSSRFMSQAALEARLNGYPLVTDQESGSYFGNAYQEIFVDGNSQETVFELVFDNSSAGRGMLANGAVDLLYGNGNVEKGRLAPSTVVLEDVTKTAQRDIYADRTKQYDARMYECSNTERQCISKFVYQDVTIDFSKVSNSGTFTSGYTPWSSKYSQNYNSSNWIIYRLSDIMLLKAEALTQQLREGAEAEDIAYNEPIITEAFTLVNAVNKRSIGQDDLKDTLQRNDYSTKSQMEELVLKERQRELMFEGKRWYDLVRRSLRDGSTTELCSAVSKREGINSQYVQNFFGSQSTGLYAIFWPYNDEETKVNLNLAAHQNPAFSSGEESISK